ncbi:DMT family transporter [Streptomyces sp. NPDC002055]|uniref:DMT family transporter n=1 Tax=Streptomyces sp. NPDC002055 TaxID=3154534 RepID=UPI0033243ED7
MRDIRQRNYTLGLPAALAATALWGFTFLGPAAVAPVNIYCLVVGRYAVFGALSVVVLAIHRDKLRQLGMPNVLRAMHLGVVGYIGFYLLLSMSAEVAGGVLASTLTGLIPAMVALVSNSLEKALEWRRLVLSIVVMSGGLLLVNGGAGALASGDGHDTLVGTALGFAACVAWSYFVVVNGLLLRRARTPVDNTVWTACIGLGACCASVFLIPLARSAGGPSPFADTGTFWTFLAWCTVLAVLGSWCATWFWNIATRHLPTTLMGPVIGMEAVFGALFNLMWEGRLPTFHELWGGLLVMAGVFLCAYLFHRARVAAAG